MYNSLAFSHSPWEGGEIKNLPFFQWEIFCSNFSLCQMECQRTKRGINLIIYSFLEYKIAIKIKNNIDT